MSENFKFIGKYKRKTFSVESSVYCPDWFDGVKLGDLDKTLKNKLDSYLNENHYFKELVEKQGYIPIFKKSYYYGYDKYDGEEGTTITIEFTKDETQEEYNKRVEVLIKKSKGRREKDRKRREKQKAAQEQKELELLAKLKEKYEK